jgi:hypothetical protein
MPAPGVPVPQQPGDFVGEGSVTVGDGDGVAGHRDSLRADRRRHQRLPRGEGLQHLHPRATAVAQRGDDNRGPVEKRRDIGNGSGHLHAVAVEAADGVCRSGTDDRRLDIWELRT